MGININTFIQTDIHDNHTSIVECCDKCIDVYDTSVNKHQICMLYHVKHEGDVILSALIALSCGYANILEYIYACGHKLSMLLISDHNIKLPSDDKLLDCLNVITRYERLISCELYGSLLYNKLYSSLSYIITLMNPDNMAHLVIMFRCKYDQSMTEEFMVFIANNHPKMFDTMRNIIIRIVHN
jgi:hypothetical protein